MGMIMPEEQQPKPDATDECPEETCSMDGPNLNATDESYKGGMIMPDEQPKS